MNELEIHHLATIITDSNKNDQWMQKLMGGSLNNKACWGTIHFESLMLLHVLQAGTLPLFWSLFWRIFVYWTGLEVEIVFSSWAKGRLFNVQYDKDNDSLLGKCQAGLLAPYIRFQFPKPGFLSYNMTPFVQESPGPAHITLWEQSWGTRQILTDYCYHHE